MLDYTKTREEAERRRQQLTERKQEIAKEQSDLLKEAADIDQELYGLTQILEGVKYVQQSPPPDLESPGITDHIRTILQRTTVPLLPTQIRASLKFVGIAGSSDKNLLISVHTILERLRPHLEETKIEGKAAYRWKSEAIPPNSLSGLGDVRPRAFDALAALAGSESEIDDGFTRPKRRSLPPLDGK